MRVVVNDVALYFDVEGAGLLADGVAMRERPTLLLLHGGPGFDHTYFKPYLSPLADTVQLVYLDLRCQGRSARVALETCTLEQMASDIVAFCATLGIERPIVLGHSFGSFVALTLAAQHPGVAAGLILVAAAAASAETGDVTMLEARGGQRAVAAAGRLFTGDFSDEATAAFTEFVAPTYTSDPAHAGVAATFMARSNFNAEVSHYYFANLAGQYDLRSRLAEIRVPTLVIASEDDWVTPPRANRTIAEGIDGAELLVLPNTGHFSFAEQPEQFLAAVRSFVTA